jgi:hypothetical protein
MVSQNATVAKNQMKPTSRGVSLAILAFSRPEWPDTGMDGHYSFPDIARLAGHWRKHMFFPGSSDASHTVSQYRAPVAISLSAWHPFPSPVTHRYQ